MQDLALAVGVIFLVNLMPAFGPPTWAILVFFHLTTDAPAAPLVLAGALAAASGRLLLATGARRMRGRLSPDRVANLEQARAVLTGTRAKTYSGLGLFALSPVPSAQLFVAAGLVAAPLVPLTAAFFAGRLVSYTLYVAGASVAADTLGSVLKDPFSSPLAIAIQLAMIALLVVLVRVDWARIAERRGSGATTEGGYASGADGAGAQRT